MTVPGHNSLSQSKSLYERACHVMPGGIARGSIYASPHPVYVAQGDGPYVEDVDGNRYLDFQNNFGTLIHGHGFSPVIEAVQRQTCRGLSFGAPTESEIELAEILCARVPHFEHVRFVSTGTEAVMNTIKAARAITGRTKIAKYEGGYHGSYDPVEVSLDSSPENWGDDLPRSVPFCTGVQPSVLEETIVLPFNDTEKTERLLKMHAAELAAVLIDPFPNRVGLVRPDPEYLKLLRGFTREHRILLISDEVLSFRLAYHSASTELGLEPDLSAIGKVIGGGLPIGAVAGRADVMAVFDPSHGKPAVSQGGTFSANPISMTAGAAAMTALTPSVLDGLNELGDYARRRLEIVINSSSVNACVTGVGSLFRLHMRSTAPRSYRDLGNPPDAKPKLAAIARFAQERGVILSSAGLGVLSTPMDRTHIDHMVSVIAEALAMIGKIDS